MLHIHNLLTGIFLIDSISSLDYLPLIASFLKGENQGSRLIPESRQFQDGQTRYEAHIAPLYSAEGNKGYNVGFSWSDWYPEEIKEESVAIITITGVITKYSSCENYGMQNYVSLLNRCYANDKIKGIIISLDTPGGETRAMTQMIDTIEGRNKPVVAYVSDGCYSAGVGIASACDAIFANNEFAGYGSIGTMQTLINKQKYFEKEGIDIIELYASASKDKNQEFRDIIEGKTENAIKRLDAVNTYFLDSVQKGRGERLTADRAEWGTGKTWPAPDALKMGLIDGIDTLRNVIDSFI